MKLNQLIRFQEELNGYRMDMLNGTVTVPKIPGAYNIATGCGSGKTAIIKQVIEQKYECGIVVFCRTIEECNNLYDFTVQNVIPLSYGNLNTIDIANLCSEPRIEEINGKRICTNGVNNGWKDNLDSLANKKVIIATHSVLMNTPLDKLMTVNCTRKSKSELHIFQKAFGLSNNVRQFMIIDELPLHEPLQMTIPVSSLLMRMTPIKVYRPDHTQPGKLIETEEFRMNPNDSYSDFKSSYEMLERIDPAYKINKSGIELNDSRRDMLLSSLYVTMENKVNEAYISKKNSITVKYGLQPMLLSGGIPINLWIFEGTGDLTLSTNDRCGFISYPNKYSGENVDVIKIHNNLKSRTIDVDKMFKNKMNVLDELNKDAELLKNIIKCNNETLIIVWKNLKAKYVKDSNTYDLNLAKYVMNDEFDLVAYYKNYLDNCGELTGKKYHIIHYGSGKDLATNEFRNCDSIVRLGLFQIPNEGLRCINDDLGTEMNMKQFILYQNIQALSRTHLRLHEGKKVRFYVSEDYKDNIDNLANYLKYEGVNVRLIDSHVRLNNVNKKLVDKVNLIMNYDPNVFTSIIMGIPYRMTININTIFELIPMDRKKTERYYSLIKELSNLGIELNIENNK